MQDIFKQRRVSMSCTISSTFVQTYEGKMPGKTYMQSVSCALFHTWGPWTQFHKQSRMWWNRRSTDCAAAAVWWEHVSMDQNHWEVQHLLGSVPRTILRVKVVQPGTGKVDLIMEQVGLPLIKAETCLSSLIQLTGKEKCRSGILMSGEVSADLRI